MKRSHTNTRQAKIKTQELNYKRASGAKFRHLESGRRTTVSLLNRWQAERKAAHDRLRRMRHAWAHLPSGCGPRPDTSPGFAIEPKYARQGERAIGLRAGFITEGGAKRLSTYAGRVVIAKVSQSPWASYYTYGVWDAVTGQKIANTCHATFLFEMWHPANNQPDDDPAIAIVDSVSVNL